MPERRKALLRADQSKNIRAFPCIIRAKSGQLVPRPFTPGLERMTFSRISIRLLSVLVCPDGRIGMGDETDRDTARTILEECTRLCDLAVEAKLHILAHLLSMAVLEASKSAVARAGPTDTQIRKQA